MRKYFAPEVVQTSNMDCGPAALKCLLEGFGIHASYERLREACQTSVDGTSIDAVEVVAGQLGLEAEQILVPADHVFLPNARSLPAIVVLRLPGGLTHFVVAWRKHGRLIQVMDPAVGRRWVSVTRLRSELYRHAMTVPAGDWFEFARSEEFQHPLRSRLHSCGVHPSEAEQFISRSLAEASWRGLATLDAALRLVTSLIESGALPARPATAAVLKKFCLAPQLIPESFWSVREAESDGDCETVVVRGVVIVRVAGRSTQPVPDDIGKELSAAIAERRLSPARALVQFLKPGGLISSVLLLCGPLPIAFGLLVEAILFRGLFDVSAQLGIAGQRIGAMAAVVLFSAILLLLEFSAFTGVARISRLIETRLRTAFLCKIPRLSDRYFQSRLLSDMAERSHATHRVRHLPDLLRQLLNSVFTLLATAAGVVWLEPSSAPFIFAAVAAAVVPAFTTQSLLRERDLRVRSHAAGLTRFYLDAMLGLQSIRAHAAERSVRREHEKLLGSWAHAALRLQRLAVTAEGVQMTLMFGLVASLLLLHPVHGMAIGRVLLVIYWALNLPGIGQEIATLARQYPYYRNLTVRLFDPLRAPQEESEDDSAVPLTTAPRIEFRAVSAEAAGQTILNGVSFSVEPGSHVAIVGSSGAGKSSLVGILLGWLRLSGGEVLINGVPLNAHALRRSVAWVDPSVQVWNRSLYSNLLYGSEATGAELSNVLDSAMLRSLLEGLPEGLQTKLGESGGLVSGGEGQRVRLGRAMLHPQPKLVILDEPFRGLDREKRLELLARARRHWAGCTLLCITHDLADTLDFDRVLVVERGQVVQQGAPVQIAADESSRYAELLAAEDRARAQVWDGDFWRRIGIHSGHVVEHMPKPLESKRPETIVA